MRKDVFGIHMRSRDVADKHLYQGTLDLLIFRSILNDPLPGWGIAQWLEAKSGGRVQVPQGSLYPALQRLERRGLIKSTIKRTPEGRKSKHYALSQKGHKALLVSQTRWEEYTLAVAQIIEASGRIKPTRA